TKSPIFFEKVLYPSTLDLGTGMTYASTYLSGMTSSMRVCSTNARLEATFLLTHKTENPGRSHCPIVARAPGTFPRQVRHTRDGRPRTITSARRVRLQTLLGDRQLWTHLHWRQVGAKPGCAPSVSPRTGRRRQQR